ncbi:cell division protein FtsA [Chlorobium sp. N1]|uniref:cell division protein FtsA n=1 Tax=Chlorobium sp. N1 TaxID=2491138 RepID=UPI0013F147E3|nr:cell division protein FtsA [Chlorobium sp. N1]
MPKSDIAVGLDIGTTKVCVVVAEQDARGKLNLLGRGLAASDGLQRATVVNINKTVEAIRAAVADAERESSIRIGSVNVGISGTHVHCIPSTSEISINQSGVVTESDVRRFLEKARSNIRYLDIDNEIIHVIPQSFTVDDQEGLPDPIGMAGTTMKGSACIVVGQKTKIRNIRQCVEKAGLVVGSITFEPLASGRAVMRESERRSGVAVIDIGGGTTEVAVYLDGAIHHSDVIRVAASDVTGDIAYGVKTLHGIAEEMKLAHGCACASECGEEEELVVEGIEGRPRKYFPKSSLTLIIEARMTEIFEMVRDSLKQSGLYDSLNAGAIITGGGSLLKGTETLASRILGLDVRTGCPEGVSGGIRGAVDSPIYATVTGLVGYAFEHAMRVEPASASDTEAKPAGGPASPQAQKPESEPEPEVEGAWQKIQNRFKKFWEAL